MLDLFKRRNFIGLDIGNHMIKAIQMRRKGDSLRVVSLAIAEVPTEVQEEADPYIKNDLLAHTIKELLYENSIKSKHVVTAIAGDAVIVRYVKLPFMTEDELKNVISYEAEQYIPLAIDQVVLDFEVLGELEEDGQRKIEVLLVAAKEEIIELHINLIKQAGLTPAVIDVDSFALQNAYEFNHGIQEGETIALINIGAKLTTINIIENGITHLTRDVAVAGNNFTREIQREFDLGFAEAEKLKRQEGEVLIESEDIMQMEMPKKEDNKARIAEAMTPVLNKLVAEIQRSFDYYESSIRKSAVTRVVLSGGNGQLKNLDKYLGEKLDITVELSNPFKNLIVSEKEFDIDYIDSNAQLFNIAVGLALRQME